MRFFRNLSAEQIRNGIASAYLSNCNTQCEELKPFLEEMLSVVPDRKASESFNLVFYPNKIVMSVENLGTKVIKNADFSKVILKTWLGEDPPSNSLKEGILGTP